MGREEHHMAGIGAMRTHGMRLVPDDLSSRLAVLLLTGLLVLMVVPPLAYIVQDSFEVTAANGQIQFAAFANFQAIFSSDRFWIQLRDSCLYALCSGTLAVLLGAVQAWIVERTDTPGRHAMYLVAIMSLAIPNVLYAIAWLLVLSTHGPVNEILRSAFGGEENYVTIYGLTGMILIEGFAWAPLALLLLSSVFRNFDPALEEVA
jgi:iron(III) transport system permease protein